MKPFLTCSSPPQPLHRNAIRPVPSADPGRRIWIVYARLIPTAPASDRWARSSTGGPRALIGGVADRRRGHDGGGHAEGAGRGRAATGGGPVPGRAGGASHAGARPRAGGRLAGGGGAGGRHGPADPARRGAPLRRRGPQRPAPARAEAAALARAGGRAGDRRGARAGPRPGWRGALAPGRPAGPDRDAVRGPAARALGRQGAAPARLRPPVGAPPAPEGGRGGAGGVQKSFAELAREALPERARGKPVEVWFKDEARVGQQGTLTRVRARRGTRPRAPRDRRHAWAYPFGAVCPERAIGAALVLPYADAAATGLHLAEIGRHVAPGVVVLDGAGWHAAGGLAVPGNLTLLPLPSYSPELNPVENVWEYLRRNKLGLRVWPDYDAIVATCCEAWNWLVAAPHRLPPITPPGGGRAGSN